MMSRGKYPVRTSKPAIIVSGSRHENDLPRVDVWRYCEPPKAQGGLMEFRLLYKGRISPETNRPRSDEKRHIRSRLHPQLQELWSSHPRLITLADTPLMGSLP